MRRDTLELACDDSFITKTKKAFTASDTALLHKAYAFSREKCGGSDSESFLAADLLLAQDADAVTIACALIAPLVWEGRSDIHEVRRHFDRTLATAIEGLNSPFLLRTDAERYHREDINGLLSSMRGVPRQALLLITFRLLSLENATDPGTPEIRRMARETLDFYVPIANRLGLGELRRRLEDVCFHILDPAEYESLKEKVAPIQAEDDRCLRILLEGVRRLLDKNRIQGRVQGRTKSLFSIWRKMGRTGKTMEDIMDRIGLRIIVTSVPDCYTVLGMLHSHFKPIPNTFDDYIGLPKDNGYQSLHTCVYPVREISQKPIEFQVRTELMHLEAEHGAAAHWRYKENPSLTVIDRDQARWMEGLVRQHEEATSAEGFIDLLHRQVFGNQLVVFGKAGRIVRLPDTATVRDYLITSNMDISKDMVVKVNGKAADLDRPLHDGDSIEVLRGEVANAGRHTTGESSGAPPGRAVRTPFDDTGQPVGNQYNHP